MVEPADACVHGSGPAVGLPQCVGRLVFTNILLAVSADYPVRLSNGSHEPKVLSQQGRSGVQLPRMCDSAGTPSWRNGSVCDPRGCCKRLEVLTSEFGMCVNGQFQEFTGAGKYCCHVWL